MIGYPKGNVNILGDVYDGAGKVDVSYNLWTPSAYDITISQATGGAIPEAQDEYGASLTLGDLNLGGIDDLIVGSPRDSLVGEPDESGLTFVRFGSANGRLDRGYHFSGSSLWEPGKYDWFGFSSDSGDVNADGIDDIAVGAPGRNDGSGAFVVFLSSSGGIGGPLSGMWTGTIDDLSCEGGTADISMYMLELDDGTFEGWGWNTSALQLEGQSGCPPLGRRTPCTPRHFEIQDGGRIDDDSFWIMVSAKLIYSEIPDFPLLFSKTGVGDQYRGSCYSDRFPAECSSLFLEAFLTQSPSSAYVSWTDLCVEECDR